MLLNINKYPILLRLFNCKNIFDKGLLLAIYLLIFNQFTVIAQADFIGPNAYLHGHPRILLFKGEEGSIKKTISTDEIWSKMHEAILAESDKILSLAPIERIQIGRRLLDKSREALRRLFFLSYAYRSSGEQKYFKS